MKSKGNYFFLLASFCESIKATTFCCFVFVHLTPFEVFCSKSKWYKTIFQEIIFVNVMWQGYHVTLNYAKANKICRFPDQGGRTLVIHYHNDTKYSDSQVWVNSTVMILSFRTGRSGQTVQTQIRLLLIRVYTVCNSSCIFWMHYSTVKPSCLNFSKFIGRPNF